MEFEFTEKRIKFSRELSDIDKFVMRFVGILNDTEVSYIIISGYIPILFGRSRTTEDVDMFIKNITNDKIEKLSAKIENSGMWIINRSDQSIYEMLKSGTAIRVAEKLKAIPNIEVKITNDHNVWKDRIEVILNGFPLYVSGIESQIAFKFYLGSEKDIEDAVHLYEVFKDNLDMDKLTDRCKRLNVIKEMNKYVRSGQEL